MFECQNGSVADVALGSRRQRSLGFRKKFLEVTRYVVFGLSGRCLFLIAHRISLLTRKDRSNSGITHDWFSIDKYDVYYQNCDSLHSPRSKPLLPRNSNDHGSDFDEGSLPMCSHP